MFFVCFCVRRLAGGSGRACCSTSEPSSPRSPDSRSKVSASTQKYSWLGSMLLHSITCISTFSISQSLTSHKYPGSYIVLKSSSCPLGPSYTALPMLLMSFSHRLVIIASCNLSARGQTGKFRRWNKSSPSVHLSSLMQYSFVSAGIAVRKSPCHGCDVFADLTTCRFSMSMARN